MNSWLRGLVDLVFPPECHICEVGLAPGEKFICRACAAELPRTGFHRIAMNPVEERFAGQFPFERATSLFFYTKNSPLSQLIQDMKYRSYPGIGILLGEMAAKELFSTGFFADIDVVTSVPMHWYKKARRGYNQSERIAVGIGQTLNLPVAEMLKMRRPRKTQTRLSEIERLKNADNLFQPLPDPAFNNKGVLLVDDICTTGTTLGSAAATLMKEWPDVRLSLLTIGTTF